MAKVTYQPLTAGQMGNKPQNAHAQGMTGAPPINVSSKLAITEAKQHNPNGPPLPDGGYAKAWSGTQPPQNQTQPIGGSMPYQPPGPVTQPPVNGGTGGVSNSFNPSAPPVNNTPPPVKPPPMPYSGGQPPIDLPPVRMPPMPYSGGVNPPGVDPRGGFDATSVFGSNGLGVGNLPLDPHTPIGFGSIKPPSIPTPNEAVNPDIGRIPPAQGGIVSNPLPHPPPVPPTLSPSPIPEPVGGGNANRAIGQPLSGAPAVVPPGGYAPIPEPTLPVGYNPGGGVGGVATQPIGNPVTQPGSNPAPFPETPIKTNADRAELAPPPGSYTKFADKGKWSGQDAQAQNIANKRAAKKDKSGAEPDTGNIIAPNVPKKKKASGGTTSNPKQGSTGQNGAPEASGTNKQNANANKNGKGKNANANKNGKANKNAKVTKADKQKAANRKPQPGTPARPYRNRGVNYRPLGYGGTLRI